MSTDSDADSDSSSNKCLSDAPDPDRPIHIYFTELKSDVLEIKKLFKHYCKKTFADLPTDVKAALKKINTSVAHIEKNVEIRKHRFKVTTEKTTERLKELEKNQENLNALVQKITEDFPRVSMIKETVTRVFEESIQEALNDGIIRAFENLPAKEPLPKSQTPSLTLQSSMTHNLNQQQTEDFSGSDPSDPAYRIIQIKSRSKKSGKEIMTEIAKVGHATTAMVLDIRVLRKSVEILCRSIKEKDILKREFETHQQLNRDLNFFNKPIEQLKCMLYGVPKSMKSDQVADSLNFFFNIPKTRITFIRSYAHRNNENLVNWTLLLPKDAAAFAIEQGNVCIGMQRCGIRPFASIIRCLKCQKLGHVARVCTSKSKVCDLCSGSHKREETCNNQPSCINCMLSPEKFPEDHSPASNKCPTYQRALNEEKHRLNTSYPSPFPPIRRPSGRQGENYFERDNLQNAKNFNSVPPNFQKNFPGQIPPYENREFMPQQNTYPLYDPETIFNWSRFGHPLHFQPFQQLPYQPPMDFSGDSHFQRGFPPPRV